MLELLAVVLQITIVIIWDWETPEKLFQVMATERIPKPWNVVEHLSTALTLVSLIQCQNFFDFLKA